VDAASDGNVRHMATLPVSVSPSRYVWADYAGGGKFAASPPCVD